MPEQLSPESGELEPSEGDRLYQLELDAISQEKLVDTPMVEVIRETLVEYAEKKGKSLEEEAQDAAHKQAKVGLPKYCLFALESSGLPVLEKRKILADAYEKAASILENEKRPSDVERAKAETLRKEI